MFDDFLSGGDSETLRVIAAVIACLGLIPLLGFVYRYATTRHPGERRRRWSTTWRQTTVGRTLMYQKLSISAYIVFLVLMFIFPNLLPYDLIRVVLFSIFAVLFWRVFYSLIRTQNEAEREIEEQTHENDGSRLR